jgi:histidyl-tRNA synthetase
MIQLIRGFKDILPGEVELWQFIEKQTASLFENFGFKDIRIPIMERTELFSRSIGEETDIVEKEMYTFADRKGDLITLRPEATASIVRSYIQHRLYAADPVQKLYTIGPMFRRERPQKGRYRQFYQIDAEVFGVSSPLMDAQIMFMLMTLFARLSVTDCSAKINSLGCPDCRPAFTAGLSRLLTEKADALCEDCARRSARNPLRVLDCKVPACKAAMADAPSILDFLCPDCRSHFDSVMRHLTLLGVPFELDKRLVRGLDYYTRTAFEIQTTLLGAQSAIAGGGRYDGLVKALGGPDIPAIGFAIGVDRLAEIAGHSHPDLSRKPKLFIAALGDVSRTLAFEWVSKLAAAGIHSEMDMAGRSLKSQMKQADRLGAEHVLISGDAELEKGQVLLRDMATKDQFHVPVKDLVEAMRTRFA